jgi:hypothetical protein
MYTKSKLVKFFNSQRVFEYIYRLKLSTLFITLLSGIQIFIWLHYGFAEVNKSNTIIVIASKVFLIIMNIINFFKLIFLVQAIDEKVLDRINWIFYTSSFGFVVNTIETIYTLFGPYLQYFEGKLFLYSLVY